MLKANANGEITLWRLLIAGIEAVQMIGQGQVLGITRNNLHGQGWVFGALLGRISQCAPKAQITGG